MDVAVTSFGNAYRHTAAQQLHHSVRLKGKAAVGTVEVTFETVVPADDDAEGARAVPVDVPEPPAEQVFASRMRDILNASATNVGIAVGVRTGLFDAMAAAEGPVSLAELALRTRLEDRYIEEWLALMVSGGIVLASTESAGAASPSLHTPAAPHGAGAAGAGAGAGGGASTPTGRPAGNSIAVSVRRYRLVPGAAPVLATSDTGDVPALALRSQQLQAIVAEGYDHMAECFAQGAGVPAGLMGNSTRINAELRSRIPVGDVVQRVPGLRAALVEGGDGARVCICGDRAGSVACAMAAAYPTAHVVGWAPSPEEVEAGKAAASKAGVTNCEFVGGSVDWGVNEDAEGSFAWVLALQGLSGSNDPVYALDNLLDVLRPGGSLSLLQLAAASTPEECATLQPLASVEYATSLLCTLPVSRSGDSAGMGLLWDNDAAMAAMAKRGFTGVACAPAPWNTSLMHLVGTKPATASGAGAGAATTGAVAPVAAAASASTS